MRVIFYTTVSEFQQPDNYVFPHGNFKNIKLAKFLFILKFMDFLHFSLIPEGHFTRWENGPL